MKLSNFYKKLSPQVGFFPTW